MLLLQVRAEPFADVTVDVDEGVGGGVTDRRSWVRQRRHDPRQKSADNQSLRAVPENI